MSWGEKIANLVTGKTPQQREADRTARGIAKRQVDIARFEAEQEEAVRYARESAKIKTNAKIQRLKQNYSGGGMSILGKTSSKPYSSPIGSGFGSADIMGFGGGGLSPSRKRKRTIQRVRFI